MIKSDNYKIKRALISVSDKNGIVDFAKELSNLGIEIYSTGGTSKLLKDNNINVKSVSDLTGFPEILDGRVKTLHPIIHAGLLAQLDKESHLAQLKEHNIDSIDLLVVNLYPFEETINKTDDHEVIVENIDIGGPTMIRAAAKNYQWTAVVVNPKRYSEILDYLKNNDMAIPEKYRAELAGEVFSHTAYYDSLISGYFCKYNHVELPDETGVPLKKSQELRYGENPHQKAALYGDFNKVFKQLHGKELSYNNIIDIDSASKTIIEFEEPSVVIVKHTNPCGVGSAATLKEAYEKAFATDTESPYGGIIAVNRPLDIDTATILDKIFTEVVIAPEFTPEALELLLKKKNRRLITAQLDSIRKSLSYEVKSVTSGYLMQEVDVKMVSESDLKVVTNRAPSKEEIKAMMFGWKVVKHVKSNAIVYAKADRTIGVGCGQMSRVESARIAADKAKMMNLDINGSAMASDAYFPFADGLLEAVKIGITAVIQPGGSIRDEEVIKAANENNVAMVFTGNRHFRH